MAKSSDLQMLVAQFAAQIESLVARRANEAFAAKFDAVKSQLIGGGSIAPTKGRVGRPPGSRASYAAALKPCPVCGTNNKARRFSYLCENHRTAENLAKFKGTAKDAKPVAERGPGRPPKVAERGPGRPPKSRSKA